MQQILRLTSALCFVSLLLQVGAVARDKGGTIDLSPVLGKPVSWNVALVQGAKQDFAVAPVAGKSAIQVGTNGLYLTSKEKVTGAVELQLRFRMTSPEDKGCYLAVMAGLPKEADPGLNPLRFGLQIHAGPEPENMTWSSYPLPEQKDSVYGNYTVPNLPSNRLTWPEMVRARVEQEVASEPRLTQRFITLRYQLMKNAYRIYLDDRLLREGRHAKIETTGFVKLQFNKGVEIAGLKVVPLAPEDPRFETVGLEGYLNADKFRGETVSLSKPGQTVTVGGVPFVLPRPDEKAQSHIDLKPSWLSCGIVEGAFDGWTGDLHRWRGALERNPGRIQFRVPNAPYAKLHLLACYSGEADTTPTVTAQFFRDSAGFPVNFAGKAPLFSAAGPNALALRLGKTKSNLHLLTIPLEPDGVSSLSDLQHLEFELTKEVRIHRSFPDPIYYSMHGGGLPSGVHIFGITLERPAVEVDFQADAYAHIWTAPAKPSYTARLKNISKREQNVLLELTTTSHSGTKATVKNGTKLMAGAEQAVKLPLSLTKYGYHAVELKITDDGGVRTQRRSLAYLHPDTRERGNWEEGKGPIFGMWDWNGGHVTPGGMPRLKVMAQAGMESSMGSFTHLPKDEQKFLESIGAKSFFLAYQLAMTKDTLGGIEWDPKKPAAMQAALIKWLKSQPLAKPSKINHPELAVFFAEPLLGPISYMSQPEHYGEPPYQMTPEEKAAYQKFHDQFVIAAAAIKKEWPKAKCLFPWGIPSFPIPFLRHSKEARDLMDGPALDVVLFERLPEMQLHQVTMSSGLWQLKQEWLKSGKKWPTFSTIEGPAVSPAMPGALTAQQEMDHTLRAYMILAAYGTTRHLGYPIAFHCASYWGETHYGGGMCDRIPLLCPREVYSAYATLTRQLNRMNFIKIVPTGSNTTFCLQFKHYKKGELLHILWTLRGTRPATLTAGPKDKVAIFDVMDNLRPGDTVDGRITVSLNPSLVYVRGLSADPIIKLGPPDHADSQPDKESIRLGDLGDGSWTMSAERDLIYEDSHAEFIRRFPGKFSIKPAPAEEKYGKALSIHLEKQDRERKTMPFYTTLVPKKPIAIPGKVSHLGMWVRASSDWGRVVYCLKDAKGERWISVGQKGEWNVDDTHCWSQFCFDGWRYLRFEMPGNQPYDVFRDMGTTYWGHYGQGDGIVDYPLKLEKIIVERRTHVIAGTELVPASTEDVLLGGLLAEYEKAEEKTAEAVRLANLRMPMPKGIPELPNPLAKLIKEGKTDGPAITKITPPEREYDGKRCHVHFTAVGGAGKYEIWVSPYADGRGAVLLAKDWKTPGALLTGLHPNVDLYLFVVAVDNTGKQSRPGKGFKVNLKNMFPMQ